MGIGIGIALLAGVFIGVQAALLGRMGSQLGMFAIPVPILVAALASSLIYVLARQQWSEVFTATASGWWWVAFGVTVWLTMTALGAASSRIGVAATLGIAVAAQLTFGLIWDARTGVAAISVRSLTALALMAGGVVLLTSAQN